MSSSEDAGAGLRADLVALLTERGSVSDPGVAAALGQVPRHVFVPAAELAEAYADQAVVTHHRDGVPTSSASQPAMVAAMLEQLRPGGRLVAPLSIRGVSQSVALTGADGGQLRSVAVCEAMFMPLTGLVRPGGRGRPGRFRRPGPPLAPGPGAAAWPGSGPRGS
jgi:protein-L-isoaspartate O-methyltransferase